MHLDEALDFQPDFTKLKGLMPVVVQDAQSQEVLMLLCESRPCHSHKKRVWLTTILVLVISFGKRSRQDTFKKFVRSGLTAIRIRCCT